MKVEEYCNHLILKCKELKVDEAETYGNYIKNTEIQIVDGKVATYKIEKKEGIHLVGTYREGIGEFYTENLEYGLLDEAVNIIKIISENTRASSEKKRIFKYGNGKCLESSSCLINDGKRELKKDIALILNLVDVCMKKEKLIRKYECQIVFSKEENILRNSKGLYIDSKSDIGILVCSVCMEKNEKMETGFEVLAFKSVPEINIKNIEKLIENTKAKFNKKEFSTGEQIAILGNKVMADLLAGFHMQFCASQTGNDDKFLIGKEGKDIFSELITIIDDPHEKYNWREFDGEGIPTQKTNIVTKGRLKTLMYNQVAAEIAKKKTTGHAVRNVEGQIEIGPSNLYINSGNTKLSEMIHGLKKGILVTEIEDIYGGINNITGNFVCPGGGMVIENGKITGATGSIIIAGNFFDIMRNIISLGNDFEWRFLYGAYGSPSAVVDKIKIEK